MRQSRNRYVWLGAAVLCCAVTSSAHATISQVYSAAAIGTGVTVNWNVFGTAPAGISTYAQEPVGPITVHINTASGALDLDTGSTVGGFLSTDTLLSQVPGDLSDDVLVGFSTPVLGVGTQIESLISGPFTGIMDLYDPSGNYLNEVTVSATTVGATPGSAPFIGAVSNTPDIGYVIFAVDNGNPDFPKAGDVAINEVYVGLPVPEPATAGLFGVMLLGLWGATRRRERRG